MQEHIFNEQQERYSKPFSVNKATYREHALGRERVEACAQETEGTPWRGGRRQAEWGRESGSNKNNMIYMKEMSQSNLWLTKKKKKVTTKSIILYN